jgi:hypothetical protein
MRHYNETIPKIIKEKYPEDVKQTLNHLSGLVDETQACHIIANKYGITKGKV